MNIFAIIAFLFSIFFAVSPASSQDPSACTVVGSQTSFPTGTDCWGEPDFYQIRIYEVGLCTSPPTAPTTSSRPGLSSCTAIFTSATGSVVDVTPTTSSALSGVFTRPANGSYLTGYIRMDSSFDIRASLDFGEPITGDAGGNGQFCATIDGSISGGTSATCANVAPTTGTLQTPLTNFGDVAFEASASATSTTSRGTSTIDGFLMTGADLLATDEPSVTRLFGVQTFGVPVTIADTTTGVDISFRVTTGMTLIGNAGPTLSIDSGPFIIEITPIP